MAGYDGGVMQERRADEEERRGVSEHFAGQEPPTSQVGYGGGQRTPELAHHTAGEHTDLRSSEDQTRKGGVYPTTHANCKPCDAGFGSCGRGSYIGEGGDRVSSTSDLNARPSEAGSGSSGPGGYDGDGGQAHQSKSDGITDQNAKPAEAGVGSAGPGGYVGEGGSKLSDEGTPKSQSGTRGDNEAGRGGYHTAGPTGDEGGVRGVPVTYKSQHYQDSGEHHGFPVSTRPPGAVLLDEQHFDGPKYENEPTTTPSGDSYRSDPAKLPEGEVRGGVPHGVVSGHPSGAGQDNQGASAVSRPVDGPVGHQGLEPQEYGQTGSLPGESAYSQQYTQPQGPNKHASELGASKPTQREEVNMAPVTIEDEHLKEGLIAKIKSFLPGHHTDPKKMDVEMPLILLPP